MIEVLHRQHQRQMRSSTACDRSIRHHSFEQIRSVPPSFPMAVTTIPSGLIYSFPLVSEGNANWSIVSGVAIDAEARKRLDASAAELISERDAIKELLGPAA